MSGFFTELKRRNAFRVALVYVIAGWLTMQVVDVMFPALKLFQDDLAAARAFNEKEPVDWVRETNALIILGRENRGADWEAAVAKYEERYGYANSYQMAEIFADAGDLDKTFEWLAHAARVKDPGAPWAMIMPFFAAAWEDPRFDDYRALHGL